MVHNRNATEPHPRYAFVESRDVEGSPRVGYFPQRIVPFLMLKQAENRKGLDSDEALVVPVTVGDAKGIRRRDASEKLHEYT